MPLNFIRLLVFMLYFAAIGFVASTAILQSGLDLSTIGSCRAAIYTCLVFYVGSKVLIQLFLVERAHAIRFRLKRRRQDWLWLVSVAIIVIGFGSIAGIAFAYPISHLASKDRRCRIGVPPKVTVPLITYDILINAALTGVFVALLRPLLKFRTSRKLPFYHAAAATELPVREDSRRLAEHGIELTQSVRHSASHTAIDTAVKSMKLLVYKSLVGSIAMLIPTMVNIGLLLKWEGQEQGWLCFTLCTLDGMSKRLAICGHC